MKILIIKPSSLGDVVHALPFLKAVKDSFPESLVDWVISKNLKKILEDNPLINRLIIIDKDSWKNFKRLPQTLSELSSLGKLLRSDSYDIVVDLQGLLRSGLIAFFTPAVLKIGFEDAREGSRFFYDKRIRVNEASHAVDKCLEVARAMGARPAGTPVFPLHIDGAASERIRSLLGDTAGYVVIVPSARWPSKRWPAGYFASLIKRIPVPCVIPGTSEDRETVREITDALPSGDNIIDLCGKTDLKELTALLGGATAVVTNDTGSMHIAAAMDVPVVALFGPTDPVKTGPYRWQENNRLTVIKAGVSCSPCRRKTCSEPACMTGITVDMAFEALRKYL
ncbi:MAG: lipopolysaccharide heptosyltransferase I [Deferribacteres bacterium]|nr:lipopolysaccharide heptosyltransferase I [Deferribacteres bacterium]